MNTVRVENDRVYMNDKYVCNIVNVTELLAGLEIQRLEIVYSYPLNITPTQKAFLMSRLRLPTSAPCKMIYQIEECT